MRHPASFYPGASYLYRQDVNEDAVLAEVERRLQELHLWSIANVPDNCLRVLMQSLDAYLDSAPNPDSSLAQTLRIFRNARV